MRNLLLCVAFVLGFVTLAAGQTGNMLQGYVVEQTGSGASVPIVGASVYWLGTTIGTMTDTAGAFRIPRFGSDDRLVISCVGYRADTVAVTSQQQVRVVLRAETKELPGVEVVEERSSTVIDYLDPRGTRIMTERELVKAACCNLSESFETNPSIDVSFTDAITGTRQIEMLGLAGTYSQITAENLPAMRGLTSNVGLTYIPGTWVENIQVSKGVGSVANGYESITGQINVELRKPGNEEEKRLFVNVFGNEDLRLESNLHFRQRLNEHWSSMTLLHFGEQRGRMDGNGDRFLDLPLTRTVNALQRFAFSSVGGLEGQIGVQIVKDEKEGGTERGSGMDQVSLSRFPLEYGFQIRSQQVTLSGKTGHIFSTERKQSMGLQWAVTDYRQSAFFGSRDYDGRQRTGYLNLLYDSEVGSPDHRLRFGLSYLYDEYNETFAGTPYRRTEKVPGAFAEYTAHIADVLTIVGGVRADFHNLFGGFITPRIHLRYAPDQDWVFRFVAGRGQRTANVFSENISTLASSRRVVLPSAGPSYPLQPEVAWNYGTNVTHYFLWDYREATLTLDFYRTTFRQQVVVDLDSDPGVVRFTNLAGASYSNSLQAELSVQPVERLETRLAYRYLDVRQMIGGVLRERPLVSRHRAFVNLAYAAEREEAGAPHMSYDLTVQWFGGKRVPDTRNNPAGLQVPASSPGFVLVNAQVTRSFSAGLDVYAGVENLLGFRQNQPILDPENPNGQHFDTALVWGPVAGRMIYAGLRWRI
jgi:outer membrane receptor for ferrienterochelin and colicin